jgi:hypothetical protein
MSRLQVSVLSYCGSSAVWSMLITLKALQCNDIYDLEINKESTACEFMKVQPRNRGCTFTEYRVERFSANFRWSY